MDELQTLIKKEEALARLCRAWTPNLGTEQVPLEDAAGRVLCENQYAQCNLPVVRASTMDGVAVDSARFLDGVPDTSQWKMGIDYVRADTGDDFDDAFDAVIPIENVELLQNGGLRFHGKITAQRGTNVKPMGSDVKKGSLLVHAGTVLDAMYLSALAMGGIAEVPVIKKPRIAFLPTGSELVNVGEELQRGQNYDSNSVLVRQMLLDMGAQPVMYPIVQDEPIALHSAICDLISHADVLLVNAGTSKGGEDYCHAILRKLGTPVFEGIAAVPGRPMNAVMVDGKPVINLSGPSFAAFYSMDYIVRGLVCHSLGISVPKRETVSARLTAPIPKPPAFSMMVPIELKKGDSGYTATPVTLRGPNAKGSAAAMTAQGIYVTQPGERPSRPGERVSVELLRNRVVPCDDQQQPQTLPSQCTPCPNHCPKDNLRCGRGAAYFQRLQNGEEFTSSDELLLLLNQCGEAAKHMVLRARNTGEDEHAILTLTPEERQTLLVLLRKQKKQWDEKHAARHIVQC